VDRQKSALVVGIGLDWRYREPCLSNSSGRPSSTTISKLVCELRIEAFTVAVPLRVAWHDVGRVCSDERNPSLQRLGDEFRTIVGTNMRREAVKDEEIGQDGVCEK